MINKFTLSVLATVATSLFSAQFAHASGYYVREQGAKLQGHAFSGASAKALDLSTIYYNPAGLVRIQERQVEISVNLISPSLEFKGTSAASAQAAGVAATVRGGLGRLPNADAAATAIGNTGPSLSDGNGENGGALAVVPNVYVSLGEREDLKFGLGINTPFGLTIDYGDTWVGRYHAQKSALLSINLNPVVSYRLNDNLSIGGGLITQYLKGELSQAVNVGALASAGRARAAGGQAGTGDTGGANGTLGTVSGASQLPDGKSTLSAQDFGFGIVLGALYEINDNSRVGLSYRSRVSHKLNGDIKFEGVDLIKSSANGTLDDRKASAKITTPDILALGFYHGFDENLAILGEVTWTTWSVFDELRVVNTDETTAQVTKQNWRDTFFVSMGTEYKLGDAVTLQFGVAYDQSPIRAEDINFRIPDTDRTWISAGLKYNPRENMQLTAGYTHILAGDFSVTEEESTSPADVSRFDGTVTGDYSARVDILALDFSVKF